MAEALGLKKMTMGETHSKSLMQKSKNEFYNDEIKSSFDSLPFWGPDTKINRKASCPCGGGCSTCQSSFNDLKISQPNDAAEIEADQIADKVMRMSADVPVKVNTNISVTDKLHAKCDSCEEEKETETVFRKESFAAAMEPPPEEISSTVKRTLNYGGKSLDENSRAFFEPRFGIDFSHIQIHNDSHAADSARSINARAYTFSNNIVFGKGEYQPENEAGKALLAHELAHVAQQKNGSISPKIHRLVGDEESEVTSASTESTHEADVATEESYTDRLVREAIENVSVHMARTMRATSQVPIPETIMAALIAAEVSFLYRSYERLVERGEGLQILSRITELLSPLVFAEFCARFIWGVIQGLVSPITGLVHLAAGAIRLTLSALDWLDTLPSRFPALVEEAQALNVAMTVFGTQASTILESLTNRSNLLTFAGGIFEAATSASDAIEHTIVRGAQAQGRSAADSLATHFLETPLPELAETSGEIIGTVIIELVILIFTDGVGNLITKLGEFARSLRPLSRGVVAFTEVAIRAGRIISQIEHLIGVLLSRTVLRPLMPLFEALEPLLIRMRSFTQSLIGAGEESAIVLARRSARAIEETAAATTRTSERAGSHHTTMRTSPPRNPATSAPRVTEPIPEAAVVEPISEPLMMEPRVTETPREPVVTDSEPRPLSSEPEATNPTTETIEPRAPEAGLNPQELAEVGPVNDETLINFQEHPDRLQAWAENPEAAEAFRFCNSPCFPENMTPDQIRRAEAIMRDFPEFARANRRSLHEAFEAADEDGIEVLLEGLDTRLRSPIEDVVDPMMDPADRELLSGTSEADAPTGLRESEEMAADRVEAGLTPREAWEPPSGVRPRPSETSTISERTEWMRERLQMHVDEAIEHYRVGGGLTSAQEAALLKNPHMLPAFRGSRVDQFAKDTIMQDIDLADIVTAPDFFAEPDILSSILPEWFDITTRAAWVAHIQRYQSRYGLGVLLPTN